ncbi:MAG: glycosyltransferase family 2 protein [Euryarchaeota archaeon]|nr:glycosyltransferase family 2 protein [Euryarchaeota archaeon]
MESPPEISLVLPAYNEGPRLEPAVLRALGALESLGPHEVIIAEDASTDGTRERARELQQKHLGRVRHLHREQRLGRGSAVAGAFREARGSLLLYMDVDLATELKHLPELVAALRGGAQVATGSRRLPESRAERSAGRRFFSGGYNTLVRLILRSRLHDHQCGFKGFQREAALALLGETRAVHWFWDTEMLVRAQRRGMRVMEIPVAWREQGQTTVKLRRDIVGMGREVLRLWWDLKKR